MPRHPFDTTADFFFGPKTPTPGVLITTVPCRLVPAGAIITTGVGAPGDVGWITNQSYDATGPWLSSFLGMDAGLADQVAVPTLTAPQFWVQRSEVITRGSQAPYFRSHLAALPPPPASCDCGVHFYAGLCVTDFPRFEFLFQTGVDISWLQLGMRVWSTNLAAPPATVIAIDGVANVADIDQAWIDGFTFPNDALFI